MKSNIESAIYALKTFYQVVNTKEKLMVLILLFGFFNVGLLTHRFATVDAVERLMKTRCEIVDGHHKPIVRSAPTSRSCDLHPQ